MRNKKSPWVLLILLLFGALGGGILGEVLSRYPYLSWIAFNGTDGYRELFAFNLKTIDFKVISIGFNFALRINAGSLIGMLLGLIVFLRLK